MAENFYNILTNIGKAKMANAYALGAKVNLTTLVIGDGQGAYYEPTESQTTLKNQVWSGNVNSINTDPTNANWIVISALIPTTVGGFTIREAAVLDDSGNMIAIGKYPETYKPVLSQGSSKDLTINMILEISNTATVTLNVDPTVILATKKDIQTLQTQIGNIAMPTKTSQLNNDSSFETTSGSQLKASAAQNAAQGYADAKIAALINAAPGALDTLKELADAIGDDANFTSTITNLITSKFSDLGGTGRTTENVKKNADNIAANAAIVSSHTTDTMTYSTVKPPAGLDSNGIYTEVDLKRHDTTLIMKSILSGGTSPLYTTRTETYYASNGTTVTNTVVYTRLYDINGVLLNEVMN